MMHGKHNETCLRCQQIIVISEKMLQQLKSTFWERWVLSFKTLDPTSHAK